LNSSKFPFSIFQLHVSLHTTFADCRALPLDVKFSTLLVLPHDLAPSAVELSPIIFVPLPLPLEFQALIFHTHYTCFPIKGKAMTLMIGSAKGNYPLALLINF
jgi:hypothetical protein